MRWHIHAAVILLVGQAWAAVYHVGPGGSNSNPGTATAPWQTVQYGVDMLHSGDMLRLQPGTYHESVNLNGLGNPASLVRLQAVSPGKATIDGGGAQFALGAGQPVGNLAISGLKVTNGQTGLHFPQANKLLISDCQVYSCGDAIIVGEGSGCTVRGVFVHDNYRGILIGYGGSQPLAGVKLEDCIAVRSGVGQVEGDLDGIAVLDFCTDVTLRRCTTYSNHGTGIDVKSANTRMDRCLSFNNFEIGLEFINGGAVVTNCLSHHNGTSGVFAAGDGFRFWNCTSAMNQVQSLRLVSENPGTTMVRNCIFADSPVRITGNTMYSDNFNLYWGRATRAGLYIGTTRYSFGQLAAGQGPLGNQSIVADPLFLNAPKRDYNLMTGSPAIAAGTWNSIIGADLLGRARVANQPPDLGALLYVP